jgi:DNA polymerase
MTKSQKQKALDIIAEEIRQCKVCQKDKIGVAVVGEGDPDADIMFIGEAPGKNEAREGRPFIGRSGKLLRSQIESIGLKEDEVYITSPVKYLPIYVTPKPSDIAHGKTHFDKQVEIIDPKIMVLMGNTAVMAVLGEKLPIMKVHGQTIVRDGRTYFISLHPAAAIRFQKFRQLFIDDFEKLKKLI